MREKIIVCLFILCFSKSYSQCEGDECYQHFQNLIENENDDIQKIFDEILEKYGDVDGDLRNLLNELNNTILEADQNLKELGNDNNDIINTNNQSNSTLMNLSEIVNFIENEIKNISPRNWFEEIDDANKTANLIIGPTATLNDIKALEDELEKWKKIVEQFDVNNYAKDIMDIPHSVSDDLLLLETLLDEKQDTTCFSKFHEDLKILFTMLAGLLDFEGFNEEIENIKKEAEINRKDADEILANTENFLEAEKKFKDVHNLTNETLVLVEEIEKLTNNIDGLLKNKEDILKQKLKELQKSHEADLKKLYKKYNVDEFEILLDELEDINKQIEDLNNGENNSIDAVEQDIEKYIDDIDYYSCILEDCRYRKPAEAVTTFNCNKKSNT